MNGKPVICSGIGIYLHSFIGGWNGMSNLENTIRQKEDALILYVKQMRIAQDNQEHDLATLYANLAKAEEKHIAHMKEHMKHSDNGNDSFGAGDSDNLS